MLSYWLLTTVHCFILHSFGFILSFVRGGAPLRRPLNEAPSDGAPVDVREERLDVLRPLGGLVVEKEGVLPNVHDERGDEARDVADLVQRDPVVREPLVDWVLVADGPAHAAHLADRDEVRLPDVVAAEGLFGEFVELRTCFRVGRRRALLHVAEVVLVKNHSVVLEAEPSRKLRVGGHLLLVNLAVGEELRDLLGQRVGVRDVALVELEVHLQSLVGNPVQAGEVELLRLVSLDYAHRFLLVISANEPFRARRRPDRATHAHTRAAPILRARDRGGLRAFSVVARLKLAKIINSKPRDALTADEGKRQKARGKRQKWKTTARVAL